jgi:galactonate dehydratase
MRNTSQWNAFSYGGAGFQDVVQQRRSKLETSKTDISFANQSAGDLAIQDVKGWIVREPVSKRAYTVIKIQTAGGVSGYGECAPLWNAEFQEAKRLIIGQPVTSFDVAAGLMTNCRTAWAGLNIAMLDVVGKLSKAPIFQVLAGPTRYRARALAQLSGETDAALSASMKNAIAAGYKAFSVPVPVVVNRNQGQAYIKAARKRLDDLRAAAGEDMDFVLDGANQLTPGDAQMISAAIEDFHVLWFNEPCPVVNLGTFRKIAGENVTCIGLGKEIIHGGEIQNLLREDAVDIVRPDLGLNGISQIRRMAAIAETYYVAVGPNHNGGPIGTAAALHLAASIPNFFIQQIPFAEAEEDRLMRLALTTSPVEIIKEGFAEIPVGPGLGISVNEQSLEKYKEVTL